MWITDFFDFYTFRDVSFLTSLLVLGFYATLASGHAFIATCQRAYDVAHYLAPPTDFPINVTSFLAKTKKDPYNWDLFTLVGDRGFEPLTSSTSRKRSSQMS